MKKVGKVFILLIALASVGVGGFLLGSHSSQIFALGGAGGSDADDQRIVENIDLYRKTIAEDYLFDYTEQDLENGIYKGMFAGLNDPYSQYYTPEEYKRMMEDTSGEFAGVGLVVIAGEDDLITVVSAIANTPASRAGIKTNDKIVEVDGVAYAGSDLNEATQKMRGPENTKVKLTIQRQVDGKTDTLHIELVRQLITVDSVVGKLLEPGLGYVQITSFDENTAAEFKKEWEALEQQGAARFVLDLRNNPGGLLTTSQEIADMLLGEGKIVTTVDNKGKEEVLTSDASQYKEPMVVLANEGSASASEILLGALRDQKRAVSVGEKTFGKGIVQRLYPIGPNGEEGGFKLTMAEYLTPNGEKIHQKGITPDIQVELPADAKGIGPDFLEQDTQLARAIQEVKTK